MSTPTHSIVSLKNGRFAVALMTGENGTDINTTWGDFASYYGACQSAQGDSQERYDHEAIFGDNISEEDEQYVITYWNGERWVKVMSAAQFWVVRTFIRSEADAFVAEYSDQVESMKVLRHRNK